ncbi:LysR family transcriptional regulator [Saxibacter everestensis]|uniref:LysR family transcriptional regulator n=1 Tax=Saxibacter everestensis TaxID=2909229 RepID=A0ABY8QXC2_9MICO|nr:LysR family transcriptional regulator [Brevibacteriaceae bacterium ZFBP1038]
MELRHLRYFLAVVEYGTVTAAAEHLRVAQPAISRQLHALERNLGVELFTRKGPRLSVTYAGTEILKVASDLVARADRVEMVARQLSEGEIPQISIAAADTTISEIVAPFVATLTSSDVFVTVKQVESDKVHEAVRDTCDLGISASRPPSCGLDWHPLTSVPLRAYVAQTHRWARERYKEISVGELLREDLVLPIQSDPTRTALDDAVAAEARRYRSFENVPSPRLAQALAASGRGVGVATDLPRFDAYPVFIVSSTGEPVCLPIHTCWNPEHYAVASVREFVSRLEVFARTEVRDAAWRT